MMRRIPNGLLALTLSVVFVGGGLSKPAAADTKIFLPRNRDDAERRGLIWAPKLSNALGTAAVQRVRRDNGVVNFSGTVDFEPTWVVRTGCDRISS